MTFLQVLAAAWPLFFGLATALAAAAWWIFRISSVQKRHEKILDPEKITEWARADEKEKLELVQLQKDHNELKAEHRAHVQELKKTVCRIWEALEAGARKLAALTGKGNGHGD